MYAKQARPISSNFQSILIFNNYTEHYTNYYLEIPQVTVNFTLEIS